MKHKLRRDAKAILMAALAAADPTGSVEQVLRNREDLDRYEHIFVVGAGKAGGTMARAVEEFLGAEFRRLRECKRRRYGQNALD